MMLSVQEALEARSAINFFDGSKEINDSEIIELTRLATLAPTAFNLQNWHFVVAKSEEAKTKLHAAAYDQQKVLDASAVFVVCGDLKGYASFERVAQSLIEKGGIDEAIVKGWHEKVIAAHEGQDKAQYDEAFRSASLASMALMLAAQAKGYVTGPMSGFDAKAVQQALNLSENLLPVMLVAVGYKGENNFPQNPRLDLEQVLDIV